MKSVRRDSTRLIGNIIKAHLFVGISFMETLEEEPPLLGRRIISIGPKGGDKRRLAGSGWSVNLAQGDFPFLLLPFHLERIQEILVCVRAKKVGILFGHALGKAKVLRKRLAGELEQIGRSRPGGSTQHSGVKPVAATIQP
jgi:hypothetical protein